MGSTNLYSYYYPGYPLGTEAFHDHLVAFLPLYFAYQKPQGIIFPFIIIDHQLLFIRVFGFLFR